MVLHVKGIKIVTTHVVRLKVFRLKAEGTRKTRLLHFGGETADFYTKHGFKMCRIPLHNSVGRVSQTRRVSDCSGNSPYILQSIHLSSYKYYSYFNFMQLKLAGVKSQTNIAGRSISLGWIL